MSDNLKLRLAEDVATLHDGRIRLLRAVRPTEHGAGRPHSGRPHSGRLTQVDLFLWRYNMRQFETVLFGCAVALLFGFGSVAAAEPTILKLWPSTPPGQKTGDGNERDTSQSGQGFVAGKSVIRLGHVSDPTITVYRAPEENNSRVAVLICPGGGYQILAYDLEGTEVAEWFNSIGVTAVLLKYRVPRVDGGTPPIEPLQDAQRALSLVRQHAEQWQFDPEKVGVLGFSAGGNLAARLSSNYRERVYDFRDEVETVSCRPNFTMLIYPAYLFDKESDSLLSDALPLDEQTPPAFITMSRDDPVDSENALRYALGMKRANRSVELHLYATGGHGYGLRATDSPATLWPVPAAVWLRQFTQNPADR